MPLRWLRPGIHPKFFCNICTKSNWMPSAAALCAGGRERWTSISSITAAWCGPEKARHKVLFDNLTPLYPQATFNLEATKGGLTTRIIDLIAPIGKGQRALVTSPP